MATYADALKSTSRSKQGTSREKKSGGVCVQESKESIRDAAEHASVCLDCARKGHTYDDPLHRLQCQKHEVCAECLKKRVNEKGSRFLECQAPHDDPQVVAAERPENVWIFVDDSNIWIEAMKLAGKEKKFKTSHDHRIRIDIGRLTHAVASGRTVSQGFLYGSEPPPIDTVWEKIQERGWKVETKKKHPITGKEKKVDTQLVADITERACNTPEHERSTIIIIAGDADVKPAIDKVLKNKGWNVEIYMWEGSMASELKRLNELNAPVKVCYLDDHLHKITFTNMRFKPADKHHLSATDKASSLVFKIKSLAFKKRVPTKSWCEQLENLAQWPFQYYWFKDNSGKETDDLLIHFRRDIQAGEIDIKQLIKDIEECKDTNAIPFVERVETYLQYEQRKSGLLHQYEFEVMGRYTIKDCCDGMDIDRLSVCSDESDSWQIVNYRLKLRKHQRYSEKCSYSFNCRFGSRCQFQHTEEEKQYFKQHQGRGNPVRKVKPCQFYAESKCRKSTEECQWAHGEEDAWCLMCCTQGHFTGTEKCPKERERAIASRAH